MRTRKSLKCRTALDALSLARSIWSALDTPRSTALLVADKYRDHKAIVKLKDVNPALYDCPLTFFKDYLASKYVSKSVELKTHIDRKAVAYEKFQEAEKGCLRTNTFFRAIAHGNVSMLPHVERVFQRAREIVCNILGPVPSYEQLDPAFGPGACFGVRGDTSVYKKVTSNPECTYAMAPILSDLLSEFPAWFSDSVAEIELVNGSELTFAPKDASTDRVICIEPLLNGFMQKGIGAHIRDRLKRHGVDINDQTINQRLAQKAYSSGLSTIDLSSASDTISYHFVMEMVPIDWFDFLDTFRCPNYLYKGVWNRFQKFSSMGNAYTFELETLLFYAIAVATCRELGVPYSTQGNLHVYGDDIIVPREAYDLLTEVLSVCGFSVNASKSYKDGCFFESCGSDFFRGLPVRPIFLKEKIGRRLVRVYYAINSIRRIQAKLELLLRETRGHAYDYRTDSCWRALDDLHGRLVARLPPHLRLYGPEGCGDGHLIAEFDEACPQRFAAEPSWEGWQYRSVREQPVKVTLTDVPSAYALYFARSKSVDRDSLRMRQGRRYTLDRAEDLLSGTSTCSNPGSGYELRGRTYVTVCGSFCASSWTGWRSTYDFRGTTESVHKDVSSRLAA